MAFLLTLVQFLVQGQQVGVSRFGQGDEHAVIWTTSVGKDLQDRLLNKQVMPSPGWRR